MLVSELLNRYVQIKQSSNGDANRRMHRYDMGHVLEMFGDVDIATLSPAMANDLEASLAGRYAEATVRGKLRRIKTMFQFAVDEERLQRNPLQSIKTTQPTPERSWRLLTGPEALAMIEACRDDTEWRYAVALYWYAGIRKSEIRLLRTEHFSLESGWFEVPAKLSRRTTKSRRRVVRMEPELSEMLRFRIKNEHGCIVKSLPGDMHARMLLTYQAAGINDVRKDPFQTLRRTRESLWAERFGAEKAAIWCGNSIEVAAKHYINVTKGSYDPVDFESVPGTCQDNGEVPAALRNGVPGNGALQRSGRGGRKGQEDHPRQRIVERDGPGDGGWRRALVRLRALFVS